MELAPSAKAPTKLVVPPRSSNRPAFDKAAKEAPFDAKSVPALVTLPVTTPMAPMVSAPKPLTVTFEDKLPPIVRLPALIVVCRTVKA